MKNYDPFDLKTMRRGQKSLTSYHRKEEMRLLSIFGASIVLTIVVNLVMAWVVGSALTSGIKALSDSCDTRYKVEAVLAGDWFCAESPENPEEFKL